MKRFFSVSVENPFIKCTENGKSSASHCKCFANQSETNCLDYHRVIFALYNMMIVPNIFMKLLINFAEYI